MRRRRLLPILALLLLLAAAGFFRLDHLGRFGFWHDELFHVFAARSLLADGSLTVPAVGQYTRSLPVTWLTAASFRLLGESELTARLPFALISLAFIPLGFWMVRRTLGAPLAWLFAFVMAFSPLAIEVGRETRMYALFQLLYFALSFAFLWGLEPAGPSPRRRRAWLGRLEDRWRIRLDWLLAAALLLPAAVMTHKLTWTFGLTAGGYAAIMLVHVAARRGVRQALGSKYALVLAAALAGLLALAALRGDVLPFLATQARWVPGWSALGADSVHYYRQYFERNYPVLFFLFPLGAVRLLRRDGRRGFFIVFSFAGLFLLHSLVFARKDERYVFDIFPFLVLTGGSGLLLVAEAVAAALRDGLRAWGRRARLAAGVAAAVGLYAAATPWLLQADDVLRRGVSADWKGLPAALGREVRAHPVLTPHVLQYVYYFGAAPAYWAGIDEIGPDPRLDGVHLGSADAVAAVVESSPDLLIIAHDWAFQNPAYFRPDVRELIRRHWTPLPAPDRRVLVFRPGGGP